MVFPLISGLVMLKWAAILQLYFFVTAALGYVQNTLLNSLAFRKMFDIHPPPAPKEPKPVVPPTKEEERMLKSMSWIDRSAWKLKRQYDFAMTDFREKMAATTGVDPNADDKKTAAGGRRKRTEAEMKAALDYEARRKAEVEGQRLRRKN